MQIIGPCAISEIVSQHVKRRPVAVRSRRVLLGARSGCAVVFDGSGLLVRGNSRNVAAFVSTVVLWPRLSVSQPWPIVSQALMMLAVNALVLLTAAVALNDQ
jgi:hypothetical protein